MQDETLKYIRGRHFLEPEDNLSALKGQEALPVFGAHREKAPLVTVVIPAYKRPKLFRLALESALDQQGFDDYQILVVDDCADETGEASETERIARGFGDEKILYYRNRHNLGLMANWNMCYLLSRSEWVCTLHDDDFLTGNFLALMAAAVKACPGADAVFNLATQFDGDSITEAELEALKQPVRAEKASLAVQKLWRLNLAFTAGRTTGSFIRRETFLALGGFGPDHLTGCRDIIYNDDYVLSARLFARGRSYILPLNIYNYRVGSNNGSARVKDYIPDLCQEYWLSRQISEARCPLPRPLMKKLCAFSLKKKALHLNSQIAGGVGRMNEDAYVNLEELCRVCALRELPDAPLEEKLLWAVWKAYFTGRRVYDRLTGSVAVKF